MIIGNGDIGKILRDRKGALFFASGVSNSQSDNKDDFRRERSLLLEQPKDLCLFYFSSISIFCKDSPYTRHKRKMEQIIKSNWNNYNIIRLGNISWGSNPNTFINFIRTKKKNGEPFELLDEYRYTLNKDELRLLTDNLPLKGQHEVCIFSRMAKVKDLI